MNIKELEKKYEELGEEIERLKTKEEELYSTYAQYLLLSSSGVVSNHEYHFDGPGLEMGMGMVFPTKELALAHKSRMQTYNLLWAWATKLNGGEVLSEGYAPELHLCDGPEIFVTYTKYAEGRPLFKSEADAQKATKAIGEDKVLAYLKGE